jgi:ABC-type nitrate/sulfonate/bicarbonate transport system permease component
MTRRARTFPVLLSVALAFVVWFVVARLGWVGKSLLASPGEVAGVLARALRPANSGQAVFTHAAHTVGRALAGWAIALTGGGVIGLLLGWSSRVYRATEPLFEFARAIPPIMAFPLFLVAFDFGAPAFVWTIALGCLPIMVLAVARGVQGLDPARQELLAVHDVSRGLRTAASIVEILPALFLGARLTFSISLIVAVVTEMVFSPRSGFALGALAKDSQISFDTPTFFACILVLGTYGYAVNAVMRHLEWRLSGESTS